MALALLVRRVIDWWESLQVELNGQYSVERFAQFLAFSQQTSWRPIALRCVSTPLPSLGILLVLEVLPLEPPSSPWRQSPIYWTRVFIVSLVVAVGLLEYMRHQVPALELLTAVLWCTACLSTTLGVSLMTLWSDLIGHPLPFSILLGAPLCVTTMATIVLFRVRDRLRSDPQFCKDLMDHANVGQLRMVLTLVYPFYVFVLRKLHGIVQTAFIMLLPLVKIAVKNVMARVLGDRDDVKPEALGFNLEVFHALFIAYSIQSSTAGGAIYLILFKDFCIAWVTMRDVNRFVNELVHACPASLDLFKRDASTTHRDILVLAGKILQRDNEIRQDPWLRWTTWHAGTPDSVLTDIKSKSDTLHTNYKYFFGTSAVRPSPPLASVSPTPKPILKLHQTSEEVARRMLRLMYLVEFVVLVQFVEIIVPFIFIKSHFPLHYSLRCC